MLELEARSVRETSIQRYLRLLRTPGYRLDGLIVLFLGWAHFGRYPELVLGAAILRRVEGKGLTNGCRVVLRL